jgi:long-chain fatty acid transport protein
VLPSGAIAVPLTDRIAIGVAVTSPFSFETDYSADSWTRYIADRTKLTTIDIQPSIAVKLSEAWRIGVAANIEYSDAILSKYLPNLSPLLPDGRQALKGDGWDMGWTTGVQYVGDRLSAGATYKSAITHRLDGTLAITGLLGPLAGSNISFASRARFTTPWQAIGSIRYRVTPAVTANVQVTRFGWSEFDRIRLSAPPGAFVPEEYRDTWTVAAGADWAVSPSLTLRGGVYRDQTPTQNGRRDPNVPDANRTAFALGASHKVGKAITLDVAAEYLHFDRSSIDRGAIAFEGTPVATPVVTNGELARAHAVILGVGARFAF